LSSRAGGAARVAAGILASRLTGLVRQRVFAHYFGLGSEADAFLAAFRIPNVLQNLFGEGALSASFIPVYASLVARDDRERADRVAGAMGALLALVVSIVVLVGVAFTPWLIAAIAPGFTGEKRALTITLVRILFPGAGLLAMSAWCLGILNSHHRFLLSYTAPVAWNVAMIATLVAFGGRTSLPRLAELLAWGSVAGSLVQVAVQVPPVLRVAPHLRFTLDLASAEARTIIRNFAPAFVSRGVVQLSAYIDTLIASLLPTGAVAAITNAQVLYTLPVSLFGMSVSAAELPAMSSVAGPDDASVGKLRIRVNAGLRQIAFLVVPSAMAFLALGDVIAAALLQTGRFTRADAAYVWTILAAAAIGLLATTFGRLYSSTYYALRDARTPLRYALIHVTLATVLGYVSAIVLPRRLGIPATMGAPGLTASAGLAAWIEMLLLRATLNRRIGHTGLTGSFTIKLWTAAAAAAAAAWAAKLLMPDAQPILHALVVLGTYGIVYFGVADALGVPEVSFAMAKLRRRL